MNPILKLVLKKGLMADLTRIPHHLDLTSGELCGTLNSLLSTLEIISRIVNQPVAVNPSRPKPRSEVNPFESMLAQGISYPTCLSFWIHFIRADYVIRFELF